MSSLEGMESQNQGQGGALRMLCKSGASSVDEHQLPLLTHVGDIMPTEQNFVRSNRCRVFID